MAIASWDDFIKAFKEADDNGLVEFSACEKPLDMALWVLNEAKEKIGRKKLTAEQITLTVVETQEISIPESSITNALKRASTKVHRHYEDGYVYYEIMKPGKDYLLSLQKGGHVDVFYFEPDTKYSSKRVLANQVFVGLTGNLRIVDPYCGERTLDLLANLKNKPTKILTRLNNLRDKDKGRFLRELSDFKSENPHLELRDYPGTDMHDRYIVSGDKVILIGHSMKDLGAKESFAIVLGRANYEEIYYALDDRFTGRWNISAVI